MNMRILIIGALFVMPLLAGIMERAPTAVPEILGSQAVVPGQLAQLEPESQTAIGELKQELRIA
jgi:hypothetical protein